MTRLGAPVALLHCDIGSGNVAKTAVLATWLAPVIRRLLMPGAVVVCDQPLLDAGLQALETPPSAQAECYFMYRARDYGSPGD